MKSTIRETNLMQPQKAWIGSEMSSGVKVDLKC